MTLTDHRKMQREYRRQHTISRRLQEAALRALPICPGCGQRHAPDVHAAMDQLFGVLQAPIKKDDDGGQTKH